MNMLTPSECFSLYPQGSESVVELIRYRLENPAGEGAHRHHILIINRRRGGMMELWSRLLGRTVTVDQVPLVSVTGPEHYWIHAELARCYRAQGSKGRFSAHGLASSLLVKFADMDETGWAEYREMFKAAAQALAQDKEWKERNKDGAKMRAQDPEWKAAHLAAQQKSWAENVERRENHKAAMTAMSQSPEWQAAQKARQEKSWAENTSRRETNRAAMKKSWAENPEFRENRNRALRALFSDPAFCAQKKAAQQALYPDVIVTFPDGHEERFSSQGDAARATGVNRTSIVHYLAGKYAPSRKNRGYSFRYAA